MPATGSKAIIYPVVVVKVNDVMCRALLDTGAGSSYISAKLVDILKIKARAREYRHIDLHEPEIQSQISKWIMRVQTRAKGKDNFKEDEERLNIQENEQGILECRGRIQGQCPVYLPTDELFTEKLVMAELHGP